MDASAETAALPAGVDGAVEIDGCRLSYTDYGSPVAAAAPVVMIHGASATRRDLEIALLPAAAAARRVLLFDRPGHGASTRPPGGHDPHLQARLLRAASRRLGAGRPLLLAHSLGGAVALAWALQYGAEIAGLVLLAPVSHPWPGGVDWRHHAALAPLLGPVFRRIIAPVAGPRVARRYMGPPLPEGYFDRAELKNLFRPQTFKANSEDILHLKRHVTAMSARYHEINAPMRIIAGDADRTVYPDIHARQLAAQAPNAHLTILSGIGHFLQHARPQEALAALDALSGSG